MALPPRALILGLSLWTSGCSRSRSDAPSIPLQEKLARQFALYDAAREALTKRAALTS